MCLVGAFSHWNRMVQLLAGVPEVYLFVDEVRILEIAQRVASGPGREEGSITEFLLGEWALVIEDDVDELGARGKIDESLETLLRFSVRRGARDKSDHWYVASTSPLSWIGVYSYPFVLRVKTGGSQVEASHWTCQRMHQGNDPRTQTDIDSAVPEVFKRLW